MADRFISVIAPNGDEVRFREGTSTDVINRVMSEQFGAASARTQKATALADKIEAAQGPAGAGALFRNSFSFGLQPVVAGAANALSAPFTDETVGEAFRVGREAERIRLQRAREATGALGTIAEVGGALGSAATTATRAAGAALPQMVSRMPTAGGFGGALGRVGIAAKEGATMGALSGLGASDAENIGQAVGDVAMGAGGGAALGAGLAGGMEAARGLYAGGRAVANAARNAASTPRDKAARILSDAMTYDDVTPGRALARMTRRGANGAPLSLADVGGANVQATARAAYAVPGEGRGLAEGFLTRRNAGQERRAISAASRALGDPDTFRATADELVATRTADADQAFQAAWREHMGKTVPVQDIVDDLTKRIDWAKGPIRSTLERARALLVEKNSFGDEIPVRDLRSLHEAKMAIWDMITNRSDSGVGNVSRGALKKLYGEIADRMKSASPTYARATQEFADQSKLMEALDFGRRFLDEDVDDLAFRIADMSAAEKEMAQLGAVRRIRDLIEAAPDGSASPVKRVFGSTAKRKALEAIFPSRRAFFDFQSAMLREAKARATSNFVRGGSPTARIQQEIAAASDVADFAANAAESGVFNATSRVLLNKLRGGGLSPEVAGELSRMLYATDDATRKQVLNEIMRSKNAFTPQQASRVADMLRAGNTAARAGAVQYATGGGF